MSNRSVNVEIRPRDTALFRGLYESRVMTIDQIADLYFFGQGPMARKRITKLKQTSYLTYYKHDSKSLPTIVTLDKRGYETLCDDGQITDLPNFTWPKLQKRLQVGSSTLKHELAAVDAKVAFTRALDCLDSYRLIECSTWPALHAFDQINMVGKIDPVYPDGFMRIEKQEGGRIFESAYFLEIDRSHERLDVLERKCAAYRSYYRSGDFALSLGASREEYKQCYFRVLLICLSAERCQNIAAKLLELRPPILSQVWLTPITVNMTIECR